MIAYEKKETILKVENVSLTIDNNLILRDLNLHIEDVIVPGKITGQIVALLGPSGIGKTQFQRILSGLSSPTTGSVLIDNPLRPVQLGEVGWVQQNYPLFEDLTVNENVMFYNKKYTKAEAKEKSDSLLELFALWDKRKLWPAQLSGGQRQRVAIAQALMSSNHYLLLDEPFSGLDINMIAKVSDTIEKAASLDELNTIIIVSHDIPATCAIADTVLLLGKDKNPDGTWIPGAYIKKEYDLMAAGLAWEPGVRDLPKFSDFTREVRSQFKDLG